MKVWHFTYQHPDGYNCALFTTEELALDEAIKLIKSCLPDNERKCERIYPGLLKLLDNNAYGAIDLFSDKSCDQSIEVTEMEVISE